MKIIIIFILILHLLCAKNSYHLIWECSLILIVEIVNDNYCWITLDFDFHIQNLFLKDFKLNQ